MMRKRGQITLFIVLAIIVVLVIVFATGLFKLPIKRDATENRATVVKDFINSCIDLTTKKALRTVGLSGGVLDVSEDITPRSANNIFSNSLLLRSNEVMYWYYKSANNLDIVNIPNKENIESGLNEYVSDNLGLCLNKFERFRFEGYKIESGKAEANAKINDKNVDVKVEMPIIVTVGDSSVRLNNFNVNVDSNFGRLYNAAAEIINSNSNYLEELTFDTIALDEEIPLSDTEFDCSERKWKKSDIEIRLRELLSRNIQAVKLKGTSFGDADEYYQWDGLKNKYSDISANLLYSSDWPFYLDVGPSENGILKSEDIIGQEDSAKFVKGLLCLQNWNFVYTVKYPVLISLNSGDDVLQFGYMVVLENNQPKKNILAKDNFGDFKNEFCDKRLGEVNVATVAAEGNLKALSNVDMFFKCFNIECFVGKSGSNGEFNEKIPQCVNGVLIGRKEGYFDGKLPISSNQIVSGSVKLEPIYELRLDAMLLDNKNLRGLRDGENVVFDLKNMDKDYAVSVVYPDIKSIKLISGRYNVSSIVTSSGPSIIIPGESVEKCVNAPTGILSLFGVGGERCESVEMPDMTLNEAVVGGNVNIIDIQKDLLKSGRVISLYSYYDGVPANSEAYSNIYEKIKQDRIENQGFEIR